MQKDKATQQWIYREDYEEITKIGLLARVDGLELSTFADAIHLVLSNYKLLLDEAERKSNG